MPRRSRALLAAPLMALALLAGCTRDGDPKDAVEDYLRAVADDDADRACELFTPSAVQQALERFSELGASNCREVVHLVVRRNFGADAVHLRDASVTGERIDGDRATVLAALDDREVEVSLTRTGGEWRLDQAGVATELLGG